MKPLLLFLCSLFLLETAWAEKNSDKRATVRAYLAEYDALLERHIGQLSAAETPTEAAQAMRRYAKEMKSMLRKSKAMQKKYPNMAGDDIEVRSALQAITTKKTKVNELLLVTKRKFGSNKEFKKAEKALIAAGLLRRK